MYESKSGKPVLNKSNQNNRYSERMWSSTDNHIATDRCDFNDDLAKQLGNKNNSLSNAETG